MFSCRSYYRWWYVIIHLFYWMNLRHVLHFMANLFSGFYLWNWRTYFNVSKLPFDLTAGDNERLLLDNNIEQSISLSSKKLSAYQTCQLPLPFCPLAYKNFQIAVFADLVILLNFYLNLLRSPHYHFAKVVSMLEDLFWIFRVGLSAWPEKQTWHHVSVLIYFHASRYF